MHLVTADTGYAEVVLAVFITRVVFVLNVVVANCAHDWDSKVTLQVKRMSRWALAARQRKCVFVIHL